MAEKTFLRSLQARVSMFLNQVEHPSVDLSPGMSCNRTLSLLGQLLTSDSSAEGKQNQIMQTVSTVVDPLIVHVTECAAQLPSTETSVYLLNCFHFIQTSLSLHPFMDDRLERLKVTCHQLHHTSPPHTNTLTHSLTVVCVRRHRARPRWTHSPLNKLVRSWHT
jgi:hypothetical protein